MTTGNFCRAAFMTPSAISHCLLLWLCFWNVGVWHVRLGNGDLIIFGKADPQWCARSSSVTQSATCKFGPQGPLIFVLTRAFPRPHRSCNRHRSDYVAMIVACVQVQVGRSAAIDCPCFQVVQARGPARGPLTQRVLEVQVHYMQLHPIIWWLIVVKLRRMPRNALWVDSASCSGSGRSWLRLSGNSELID